MLLNLHCFLFFYLSLYFLLAVLIVRCWRLRQNPCTWKHIWQKTNALWIQRSQTKTYMKNGGYSLTHTPTHIPTCIPTRTQTHTHTHTHTLRHPPNFYLQACLDNILFARLQFLRLVNREESGIVNKMVEPVITSWIIISAWCCWWCCLPAHPSGLEQKPTKQGSHMRAFPSCQIQTVDNCLTYSSNANLIP